eukprot:1194528-Prorocentrum_minimum.AAC.5
MLGNVHSMGLRGQFEIEDSNSRLRDRTIRLDFTARLDDSTAILIEAGAASADGNGLRWLRWLPVLRLRQQRRKGQR